MPKITNPRLRLKAAINMLYQMFPVPQQMMISYTCWTASKKNETDVHFYNNNHYPVRYDYKLEFRDDILYLVKDNSLWKIDDKREMRDFFNRIENEILISDEEFLNRLNANFYGQKAQAKYQENLNELEDRHLLR